MLGGSVQFRTKSILFGLLRAELISAPLIGMANMSLTLQNDFRSNLHNTYSNLPKRGRYSIQNNQLPTETWKIFNPNNQLPIEGDVEWPSHWLNHL
jgi:hypothetical protein